MLPKQGSLMSAEKRGCSAREASDLRKSSTGATISPMDVFAKLFGSGAKVRILRLFLLNPLNLFDMRAIVERTKVLPLAARREISVLEGIGFLRSRTYKEVRSVERRSVRAGHRTRGWMLDERFPHRLALEALFLGMVPLARDTIVRRLSRAGRLKLIVTAGVFLQDHDSRLDLLVVGDGLRGGVLESAVHFLEADIGRELRYASFNTSQFKYRLGMYDRLVRDLLDYPHEIVLDRLGLGDQRG